MSERRKEGRMLSEVVCLKMNKGTKLFLEGSPVQQLTGSAWNNQTFAGELYLSCFCTNEGLKLPMFMDDDFTFRYAEKIMQYHFVRF